MILRTAGYGAVGQALDGEPIPEHRARHQRVGAALRGALAHPALSVPYSAGCPRGAPSPGFLLNQHTDEGVFIGECAASCSVCLFVVLPGLLYPLSFSWQIKR